jgi:DNA invertase Pin-like site-specific DNA recombinase
MKTAIYIRVSTDKQQTDMQLHDLKMYCALHNIRNYDVYDDYYSGTKLSRPNFDLLMRACREKKYDRVIIWKFDRLSRNVRDFLNIFHDLNSLGVSIVSFKDGFDPSSSIGKAMLHIMMALSELEVDNIRMRTRAGMAAAKARGKRLGKVPRYFDQKKFELLFRNGTHMQSIANNLGFSKSQLYRIVKSSYGVPAGKLKFP